MFNKKRSAKNRKTNKTAEKPMEETPQSNAPAPMPAPAKPAGVPTADYTIPVKQKSLKLIEEQDEVIKDLTQKLEIAKYSKRNVIRTLVTTEDELPEEAQIIYEYNPKSQEIWVWERAKLAAAQLANQAQQEEPAATE